MSCPHRHDIVHKSLPLDLDKQLSVFKPKKMQQHRDSERQPMWQSGELQARTCQVTISLAQSQHGWIHFLYSTLICFPLFSWEKNPQELQNSDKTPANKFSFMLPWCTVTHISTHSLQRKGAWPCNAFISCLTKGTNDWKGKKAYEGVILLIAFRVFLYRLKTL